MVSETPYDLTRYVYSHGQGGGSNYYFNSHASLGAAVHHVGPTTGSMHIVVLSLGIVGPKGPGPGTGAARSVGNGLGSAGRPRPAKAALIPPRRARSLPASSTRRQPDTCSRIPIPESRLPGPEPRIPVLRVDS